MVSFALGRWGIWKTTEPAMKKQRLTFPTKFCSFSHGSVSSNLPRGQEPLKQSLRHVGPRFALAFQRQSWTHPSSCEHCKPGRISIFNILWSYRRPIHLELLKPCIKVAIEVVHEVNQLWKSNFGLVNQLWKSYLISQSTVKSHWECFTLKVKHVKSILPQLLSSHLWDRWSRQYRQRRWSRNQNSPQKPGYRWEEIIFLSIFKNLFQLDIPDNGKREEVVESFLSLHLFLVQLLNLLNHLLCKHLKTKNSILMNIWDLAFKT